MSRTYISVMLSKNYAYDLQELSAQGQRALSQRAGMEDTEARTMFTHHRLVSRKSSDVCDKHLRCLEKR